MDIGGHRNVHGVDLLAEIVGNEVADAHDDGRDMRIQSPGIGDGLRLGQQAIGREAQALDPQQQLVDRQAGLHRVARSCVVQPALEIDRVGCVGGAGDQRCPLHQPRLDIGRQAQPEEMHQRQMTARIDEIVGSIVETVRLPAPEQCKVTGCEPGLVASHMVMRPAANDVVHLHLRMPVICSHQARRGQKHLQRRGDAFDAVGPRLVIGARIHLTFRPICIPEIGVWLLGSR
ncbi:hypothetical protein D3C87_1409010 [compost metagenome]